MKKNKKRIYYDEKSDSLWLLIKSGPEYDSKEVAPGVYVELGKNGELLGIEILNASEVLGRKVLKGKISALAAAS